MKRLIILWIILFFAVTAAGDQGLSGAGVLVIPVKGEIQLGLAPFIQRATGQAAEEGYDLIIYRINTFGGRLDAAVAIRDAILNSNIPTAAFIDKRAISAGALISLAADRIYMHPNSTIGAAKPVSMGMGMSKGEVSEKVISYWRTELRSTAEKNNRRGDVAEAFADPSIEIEGVIDEGKLLTLTTSKALELGIADKTVKDLQELLTDQGLSSAVTSVAEMNASEKLAGFLTTSMVSSILITIAILGIFLEFKTPGLGLPGAIALIALILFFGSQYIVNIAGWWEILLFIVGLGLLLVEFFVIPGFGVVGIMGIICIVASLFLSLIGRFTVVSDFVSAIKILAISFIVSFAVIMVLIRKLPRFTPFQHLILNTSESGAEGYRSSPDTYESLLGKEGVSVTMLRPSGTALIDGSKYSVVTEGGYIQKNSRIKVIRVEGYRIVVDLA